ncbi:MAG TPA: glycosyltransferase [Chitinophagaceae bacterium]|nr:glycosyltransferase [Chitinophagaceae bacterium]
MHVIDYAGLGGGAESVAFHSANSLPGKNYLYYYNRDDNFDENEFPNINFIESKHKSSFINLPLNIIELKKIIKRYKIDIVHSQLFWSNLTARLATPKSKKLFTSIQNIQSQSSLQSKKARIIEKWSYRRGETTFCVSNVVEEDYKMIVPGANTVTLYNFISEDFFKGAPSEKKSDDNDIKLIAVGTVKKQKNYSFLIKVFTELRKRNKTNIHLDIYGKGNLVDEMLGPISDLKINVNFKGEVLHLWNIYPKYDAFIMASLYEGCSVAALEAMASGLPLLLSDISVMREISNCNAIFFDLNSIDDCADKIIAFSEKKYNTQELVNNGNLWVNKIGRKSVYIKNLWEFYNK